jgi:hypothetical protein
MADHPLLNGERAPWFSNQVLKFSMGGAFSQGFLRENPLPPSPFDDLQNIAKTI